MLEVEVYDSVNKSRLLGTLKNPPALQPGRSHMVSYAYCHAGIVSHFNPNEPILPTLEIEPIDLFIEWLTTDGGWIHRAVIVTREPLSKLARLREFRFPGESDRAAYHRVHYN
jgi:hypothetical protein